MTSRTIRIQTTQKNETKQIREKHKIFKCYLN